LGKFIKDKLISAGVVKFGDFISDDDLSEYGNNMLKFKKLDGDRFYIEF